MRGRAIVVSLLVAAACELRSDKEHRAYLAQVASAEAELTAAVDAFESRSASSPAALRTEAFQVAEKARAAREALEGLQVPSRLADAWREELLYVNHVIPAFERFADDPQRPSALEELRSLLRRGRTHQRRARA